MRVTVKPRGPTLDQLTADTIRDLRSANRRVGRELGRVGVKAIADGAPRMFGRKLRAKADVNAWPDGVSVELAPAPGTAGAWAIAESGARPHEISPRARRALKLAGVFAASVDHPGTGGRRAWTRAGTRLDAAVNREIERTYDKAMT